MWPSRMKVGYARNLQGSALGRFVSYLIMDSLIRVHKYLDNRVGHEGTTRFCAFHDLPLRPVGVLTNELTL